MFARAKQYLRPAGLFSFNYGLTDLRGDVIGGQEASALIIPAALSFGELSGLGPVAGLYGALTIGIFGTVVGNTRGIISGVNSNVAIVMALVVAQYTNTIAEAFAVAMLAGLIQTAFGVMRLARYISYLPISLLNGFFTGVGVLLITTQIAPALGAPNVGGRVAGALQALPFTIARANLDAALVSATCLVVVILWPRRLERFIPRHLMLLIAGMVVGIFWLNDAPTVGSISAGIPVIQWLDFSMEFLLRAVQPAFMIAMISSITILMGSTLVESITGREQQANRIQFAHGLGNVAAGLVGGLAGGISNASTANALSGGRTFVSNLVVVIIVLLTIATDVSLLIGLIPKAVLASILIVVGFNIIDWRLLARLHRTPVGYWMVLVVTTLLIVLVDTLTGLVIGFVLGMFANAGDIEALEVPRLVSVPLADREVLGPDADLDDPFGARTSLVQFPDRVSVASARQIARIVGSEVSDHKIVIFDFSRTQYLDNTAAVTLGRLINVASRRRSDFIIAGMRSDVADRMRALGFLEIIGPDRMAADLDAAKLMVKPILEADIAAERASASA